MKTQIKDLVVGDLIKRGKYTQFWEGQLKRAAQEVAVFFYLGKGQATTPADGMGEELTGEHHFFWYDGKMCYTWDDNQSVILLERLISLGSRVGMVSMMLQQFDEAKDDL